MEVKLHAYMSSAKDKRFTSLAMRVCKQNGRIAINISIFVALALVEDGLSDSGSDGFTPGERISDTQ
jgi:hypothetical protein